MSAFIATIVSVSFPRFRRGKTSPAAWLAPFAACLAVAGVLPGAGSHALAASYTWQGPNGGLWNTASNWNLSTTWTAFGNTAVFNTSGANVGTSGTIDATAINFLQPATISAGGTINLTDATGALTDSAPGLTTISSAITMQAGSNGGEFLVANGSTLNFAGTVTDSSYHLYLEGGGNYEVSSGGAINESNDALILEGSGANATTLTQTDGQVSVTRAGLIGFYLSQGGSTSYTMSGGTLVAASTTSMVLSYGGGTAATAYATMTVNGSGALVSGPTVILNYGATGFGLGGNATINLQNGILQTNSMSTLDNAAGASVFNFSGGTLRPYNATTTIGSATAADNFTLSMSGANAVISSNTNTGAAETVNIYAVLSGTGNLTTVGSGTIVLRGANNTGYSGQLAIDSGKVQLAVATGLTNSSGTVLVSGGTLDINGLSPTTGAVALAAGSIINSGAAATLTGTSYTLQGGTASAVLGGGTAALTMTGPGLAVLSASNTYGGGTTITGGTLQLGDGAAHNGYVQGNISDSGALAFANPAAQTYAGVISGNGAMIAAGPALLTLTGSNTFSGQTTIGGGTLRLGDGVANNGYLQGDILINTALTFANPQPQTYGGVISGGGALTAAGPSLLTLTASSILSGPTTVSGGTLSLGPGGSLGAGSVTVNPGTLLYVSAGGSLGSGNVTVNSGAVLDVSAYNAAGGYNFNSGSITAGRTSNFGTDINGTLNVNNAAINVAGANATMMISGSLSLSGGTLGYYQGDLVSLSGPLALSGSNYVAINGALVGSSTGTTYTIFTGSLVPSTTAVQSELFISGNTSERQQYSFGTSGGMAITLTVKGAPGNLQWNMTNGAWDTGISPSWFNTTSGSADYFFASDNVTFDDRPGGTAATVNISGTVLPKTMTVSNTAVAYTFSGTGSIGGSAAAAMNGPGTLTINTSNSYSGGTSLYGGLLNLGNSAALGSGALTIGGGSLDNTSAAAMTLSNNIAQNWNAGFTFVGSNPLNLGNGPVTLGATPTVTVSGSTLTVGGNISGGYGLTVAGSGTLLLAATNSYTGDTTIAGGVLQLASSGAIPSGASAGNLAFSNAAASAVLDLHGNNATVNGLTQPSPSTTNLVVNNLSGGTATLSVGANNASSTFGGILANNTGTGGVLALTKIGAGGLVLVGDQSYSGATTISGGTLQLGSGISGQDGALASTSIVNNATLVVSNVGPTALPGPITGAGTLVQNSPSALTLAAGSNLLNALAITNTGSISGGPITLQSGNDLVDSAPGVTTISSAITMAGSAVFSVWSVANGGTLNIAAAVTDNNIYHLEFQGGGNFNVSSPGGIFITNYALVLNGAAGSPTNLTQSGGNVTINRLSPNVAMYISQSGTTSYSLSGGSMTTNGILAVSDGGTTNATLTINGPTAVVSAPTTNLDYAGEGGGGNGTVNLENGALRTDLLYTLFNNAGTSVFNFSGGTLQPLDSSISGFGSSTAADNISLALSGANAVISSNDGGGIGRTVPIYAVLSGSGNLTTVGSGTLVLDSASNNTAYSGQLAITSGTVKVGVATGLTTSSGTVLVNGGALDIHGLSPATGAVALAAGSIIDSAGFGVLNATGYTLQSGTASAVLGGGGGVALTMNGPGLALLSAANTYGGGTTVSGGTLQLGSYSALGSSSGTLLVNGGVLDINDNSVTTGAVTLASGSIVDSVGFGALNAAAYTLQSGTASAVLGGASAPLNKTTSALVVLTAANTYGGPTTVSAGTLALGPQGTLGNGAANVTVSPGAVLDVSAYDPSGYNFSNIVLTAGRTGSFATDINGSVNLSNATIGVVSPTASGTLKISGSLNLNGAVTYAYVAGDQIAVGGALALSGGNYVVPNAPLSAGTYTLLTYNSGSPDVTDDLSMGGSYRSGTRQTYALGTSGGTAVTLTVSGTAGNLYWNTTNGAWDVQTTPSWYNSTTASADVFYQADNVTFNDRPGSAALVTINTTVEPGTMTVSNTAVAYTFSGTGSIGGSGPLTMNGPGTLTINTSNSYSGGTSLYGGLLNRGSSAAMGSGAWTIGGPGAPGLDNTSSAAMTLSNNNAQNWNASFTFVGSNPLNLGSGPVTLGATPTVTVAGGTLTVGGNISGGYGLTVAGSGMLVLAAANTYAGDTTIAQGTLQVGAPGAIPNGAGTGNVVFASAANSAVLDLNGNDTTINGLSQANLSATNLVVDNAQFASNTLSVGNNNASSTFGGVLADNNNGLGGQLNLQKIGAGILTLIGSNTYSGQTTVSGGTLQLGDGTSGHDSSLGTTFAIVNNATLVVSNLQPTALPALITGAGTLVQNSPSPLTLADGSNLLTALAITNNGSISGGAITLQSGPTALVDSAPGMTTISSAITIAGAAQQIGFNVANGGTLNIAGVVTDFNIYHFYLLGGGDYTLSSPGAINISSYALVLEGAGSSATNFTQSGGSVSLNRAGSNGMYVSQSGSANYTIFGGSLTTVSTTTVVLSYGASDYGTLTVNGPSAVVSAYGVDLNFGANAQGGGVGGNGTFNLENGTFQTDQLYTYNSAGSASVFNFSGGTLQPLDAGISSGGFGSPVSADNISLALSGSNAVISSNDGGGIGRTVPIYAVLSGSGGVDFTGGGTLVLLGSNSYSGGSFVDSGTVQLGNSAALGAGGLAVNGGTVDLAGFSPTINGLSGGTGGVIMILTGTNNSTLTVSQTSSTVFGGTIEDGAAQVALVLSGPGTLELSGTNAYNGGTYVDAGTLIVDSPSGLLDGSSLTVGADAGSIFAPVSAPGAPGSLAAMPAGVTAVPEPGTLVLLAAGIAIGIVIRSRKKTHN